MLKPNHPENPKMISNCHYKKLAVNETSIFNQAKY